MIENEDAETTLPLSQSTSMPALTSTEYSHTQGLPFLSRSTCNIRIARLSWHSTAPTRTPTSTPTSSPTSSRGLSRECRPVVQLAIGITSGNRAYQMCRRGSSRGCPCRCRRRGIPALCYKLTPVCSSVTLVDCDHSAAKFGSRQMTA